MGRNGSGYSLSSPKNRFFHRGGGEKQSTKRNPQKRKKGRDVPQLYEDNTLIES